MSFITNLTVDDVLISDTGVKTTEGVLPNEVEYIHMNTNPLFTWTVGGSGGQDPDSTITVTLKWYGRRNNDGSLKIAPITCFTKSIDPFAVMYRPTSLEKLTYVGQRYAGGDFFLSVTAEDLTEGSDEIAGFFRVNNPPATPKGLRVV